MTIAPSDTPDSLPARGRRTGKRLGLVLLLAALPLGCEDPTAEEPEIGAAGETAPGGGSDSSGEQSKGTKPSDNPFGFEPWYDDYPIDFHQSPRVSGRTFDRTRKLALRSVLSKVSGQSTRESWLFAREFVGRLDEGAIEIAAEELAGALANPKQTGYAENLIEALGSTGSEAAARAVMRSFAHPDESVRNKAMAALVTCGNAEMVREAFRSVDGLPSQGSLSWAKAAVAHLPSDESVAYLRSIADDPRFRGLFNYLIEIANELEPQDALQVFESYVDVDLPVLRLSMAAWRHGAGMSTGTAELEALMQQVDAGLRAQAIQAAAMQGPAGLLDALLERAEKDASPEVRVAAVTALQAIEDPKLQSTVDLALQTRAYDPNLGVRRAALRALVERGVDAELDELLAEVRNGTGTRQTTAIEDLVQVGYAPAIPALTDRMKQEPPEERRSYLRALCLMRTPESIVPVREAFLSDWIDPVTLHDLGVWMANLPEVELVLLELFKEIPAADYQRRAVLLNTLGNMSADDSRTDEDFRGPIRELCWSIVRNDEEIPQLRLQAMAQLQRSLTLADLRTIQRVIGETKDPRFRAYLNSFLFEFY